MAPAEPNTLTLTIETGMPGRMEVMLRASPDVMTGVEAAFAEHGMPSSGDVIELAVSDTVTTMVEISGSVTAVVGTISAALRTWFHRNADRKVDVTFDRVQLHLEGMSQDETRETMEAALRQWNEDWRAEFPGRFPADDEGDQPS